MTIASSIGADVFPIISGQLMEEYPMTLMYQTATTIISCTLMFVMAIFIGRKIILEKDSATTENVHREEMLRHPT